MNILSSPTTWKQEWFTNVKPDILAGIVVALGLIPEAISFSIIAGVDPKVGLYASFIIATVTAFLGGRPAMISAATGSMALLMTDLVKDFGPEQGLQYILAASILAGGFQIIFGFLKLGKQMKYIPRTVMVGFANALAILIFAAQFPQLIDVPWAVYVMVAASLAIIYLLPRVTQIVPSPLVAIITMTAFTMITGVKVPTVGDMGDLPSSLPFFSIPQLPLEWATFRTLISYAVPLAIVGLLASLLTASLLDELTDTPSDKNREAVGQGIANIISGFLGGMGGCAMIGQSVINIQAGGRKRLSTLCSGVFLLIFILVLSPWVQQIPMAALVAVMIMVSIGTFNWSSITQIKRIPRSETVTMITTVLVTVYTRNLAIGVIVGVALSTLAFSRKIAKLVFVDSLLDAEQQQRTYSVSGQLFFVSVDEFLASFNFTEELKKVVIDLTHSHLWDQSAVGAIDKVVLQFRRNGADVTLIGVNEASEALINRLAMHNDPEVLKQLAGQ